LEGFVASHRSARPVFVIFTASALAIALTAGFGLGLWLLLGRTAGISTFGVPWAVLVQVHGTIQLFGFAALFVMGVALHVLPRFRGASPPAGIVTWVAFCGTVGAVVLRAVAQPTMDLPGRDGVLALSSILLVAATSVFAVGALLALRGGTNPHRPDELVMAAGIFATPLAAVLVAIGVPLSDAPLLVDPAAEDRAVWAMLLGSLATIIFGVWARLAPGFVASAPAHPNRLLPAASLWIVAVAGVVTDVPLAALPLVAALCVVTWALGIFGPTIARQRLPAHARATLLAVRSAFVWAVVGAAVLALYQLRAAVTGEDASYLEVSAARHSFALGFVTIMIYGVAARALPSFTDRQLWSLRLQVLTIALANAGVALRVVPQAVGASGAIASAVVGLSGVIAYVALVTFAVNMLATARGPSSRPPARGEAVPMVIRLP
jgi:uncharacterized protein involved in response to NO